AKNCANACMRPNGLHAVGNGVSLLPWMKITGVRCTGPAAPKPISGLPSDASSIAGKVAGSVVPTVPAAWASVQASVAAAARAARRIQERFMGRLLLLNGPALSVEEALD